MIIDEYYNRFNIGKLPRNKQASAGSSSVTILNDTSTQNIANTGIEGHYLWGNYFDATQDIEGTLSNVQDIIMSGDLNIDGDIEQSINGRINSYNGHIGNFTSYTGRIDDLTSYIGRITDLSSDIINTIDLNASRKVITPYAEINDLNSENIRTKNLTVTGSAHFFELVIDKIKATGGATLLTPADGFKIAAIYNPAPTQEILYFLAEDDDGNKICNMWEVGDYAIIQNFNKATAGTSYNVDNTYYWGEVVGVSTQAGRRLGDVTDDNLYHYIVVSRETGHYDGSLYAFSAGNEVAMLGNKTKSERQTAIYSAAYTPPTGAYDEDLIAPFIIYYEGINPSSSKGFNLSEYKVQWWSSGVTSHGQQNDIPQNRMVGSFLLSAGKTIQDYIDENIKDADINMVTFNGGSNVWFVNTNAQYLIEDINQTWKTHINILMNGNQWHLANNSSIEVYTDTGTRLMSYYTITLYDDRGVILQPTSQQPAASFDIEFTDLQHCIPSWYGTENRTIRIKIGTYNLLDSSNITWYNYDVQCVKLAKGENGSAASVDLKEYALVPIREDCVVDANGNMALNATYQLKYTHIGSQGETIINTNANIPSDMYIMYDDDAGIVRGQQGTKTTTVFSAIRPDYLSGTPYYDLSTKPLYVRLQLIGSQGTIDRRVIPVSFLAGSVFDVKDDAIVAAVAGSQSYTDNGITSINNQITSINTTMGGIQTRVNGLQTTVNDQGDLLATKASTADLNLTAQGLQTTFREEISVVQDDVDAINDDLEQNYAKTSWTSSQISQSASTISATVRSEIEGELNETGISITNKKITLNSANTDFLGNINLYNPNEGLLLYDEDDNITVGILNANVTTTTEPYNIRSSTLNETKSQANTFTFNHNDVVLGTYAANDYIDLYFLGATLNTNQNRIALSGATYSYTLKRGTTTIASGSGNFTIDRNNIAQVEQVGHHQVSTLGTYSVDFTITYTTTTQHAGNLISQMNVYCTGRGNSNVQMIGNDGVVFKTGTDRQIKIGENISIKNGIGNEIVLEDRKLYRRPVNYNISNSMTSLMELSSSYSYRSVSSNYTATLDDAMIQINGVYTLTLPADANYVGKSYYIMSTGEGSTITCSSGIWIGGHEPAVENVNMNNHALYHCMRFPAGWVIDYSSNR